MSALSLYRQPSMLHPATADAITAILNDGFDPVSSPEMEIFAPSASRFRGTPVANGGGYRIENGVAIIPIVGELCNRGAWIGAFSGMLSYEGISAQLRAALSDPAVTSIVFDIDSGGGDAAGSFELASEIRAATTRKPIVAFVNGMAASAAYAIATGANRIIVTLSSIVGSIGVIATHLDRSAQFERAGVKPTLIYAGAHKADTSTARALPEASRARLQAYVDDVYRLFVATVALNRNLDPVAVQATQGGMLMGQAAVTAGLADAVGTLNDALNWRSRALPSPVSSSMATMASGGVSIGPESLAYAAACAARDKAALGAVSAESFPRAAASISAVPIGEAGAVRALAAEYGRPAPIDVDALWGDVVAAGNAARGFGPSGQQQAANDFDRTAGHAGSFKAEAVPAYSEAATRGREGSLDVDAMWDAIVAKGNIERGFGARDCREAGSGFAGANDHASAFMDAAWPDYFVNAVRTRPGLIAAAALWDEIIAKGNIERGLTGRGRANNAPLLARPAGSGAELNAIDSRGDISRAEALGGSFGKPQASAGAWDDVIAKINREKGLGS